MPSNTRDIIKVGSVVRCIESISVYHGGPIKDTLYLVTSSSRGIIGFPLPNLNEDYHPDVISGIRPNWGNICFEVVEDEASKSFMVLFNK